MVPDNAECTPLSSVTNISLPPGIPCRPVVPSRVLLCRQYVIECQWAEVCSYFFMGFCHARSGWVLVGFVMQALRQLDTTLD